MIRGTFKYRLYPTQPQERQMFDVLRVCRHLYNMLLDERRWAWEVEGRNVSRFDQCKTAIHYRKTFPQARPVFSQTMQNVCKTVDEAFKAFFRRVKAGEKAGYPRYKSRNSFHSFEFPQYPVGAKIDGRRLKLFGIGRVAVRWHRPIEGKIKTVRIIHKAGKWYATFSCELPDQYPLSATGQVVGIDVGISALATLSNGVKIKNPNYYRVAQKKLRILQRSLERKKRGSKNRRKALLRVQRQQEHVANQRKDYLHKLSRQLVNEFDGIALEKLRVHNMVRNHHLSKSILDSGWSTFTQFLTYKAESAGREIAFVDPAYTSKSCSNCGAIFENLSLKDRWVTCECGLSLDRDVNASRNILKRTGWDTSVGQNVGAVKTMRAQEATRLKPL